MSDYVSYLLLSWNKNYVPLFSNHSYYCVSINVNRVSYFNSSWVIGVIAIVETVKKACCTFLLYELVSLHLLPNLEFKIILKSYVFKRDYRVASIYVSSLFLCTFSYQYVTKRSFHALRTVEYFITYTKFQSLQHRNQSFSKPFNFLLK